MLAPNGNEYVFQATREKKERRKLEKQTCHQTQHVRRVKRELVGNEFQ